MCCRFTNINNSLEKYVTHCKCILTILLNLAPVDKRIGFFYKYDCAFYLKFSVIINRSISLRGGGEFKNSLFLFFDVSGKFPPFGLSFELLNYFGHFTKILIFSYFSLFVCFLRNLFNVGVSVTM